MSSSSLVWARPASFHFCDKSACATVFDDPNYRKPG